MRTSMVLASEGINIGSGHSDDASSFGQSCNKLKVKDTDGENDDADGSSLPKQHPSSTTLLSSFLDSASSAIQQGGIFDGLIPSATSGCSIATEYRDDNVTEGYYAEARQAVDVAVARQDGEREELDEWCSIATEEVEVQGREGEDAETRDCGIELAQKRESTSTGTTKPPVQAKNSLPLSVVVKKLSEKFGKHDSSEESSKASTKASKASNSSFAKKALSAKVKKLSEKLDVVKRVGGSEMRSSTKKEDSSDVVNKAEDNEVVKRMEDSNKKSIKGHKQEETGKKAKQAKPAGTPHQVPQPSPTNQMQKQKKAANKVAKPATEKNTAATITKPTNFNNDHWTGRIVGLRLPSNIDSDFDSKNKPIDRGVDPTKFLASVKGLASVDNQKKLLENANDWDVWKKKGDTANVVLKFHLSNQNDPTSITQPLQVHMTRDPKEDISQTLKRLQLTMQKKLGGKKKKKHKKGKNAGAVANQGKQCDEAVLLRKVSQESTELAVEPTASKEEKAIDAAANLWDGFYDVMLPINACNPWSGNPQDSNNKEVLAEGSVADDYNIEYRSHEKENSKADSSKLLEGYEAVDYKDSLTIDEVLNQAAKMVDLGKYALSVPVVTAGNSNSTSLVPLFLESCPPTITAVSTFGSFDESHLFERTPIVVEVGLLYAAKARITWLADGELVCADSACYTPTKSDVGKVLTVVIVPQRSNHAGKGCEEAYQFKRRVEGLPSLPNVTSLREEFMDRPSRDNAEQDSGDEMSLRVVTYNILADQNASRDVEKSDDAKRMYAHCKNEHIIKWRRHPLILHEILEYSPDVISLQEVDTDVFDNYLKPVLNAKGYEGYYSQKGVDASSGVREGCAIFWSLDVFESVRPADMRTHTFREMIQNFSCDERIHKSQWKSLNDMSEMLEKHDHLKHVLFNKLGHIMQTVVLTQRKSQEKVAIGNTHLFFHPMASHIRCLKMLMACRQMEIEHQENQHCPMIFCGDFNSHPNSGVMKLLLDRYLDSNNGKTWKHLCTYEWEEGAIGKELHHDVEAIDLEFPASFPGLMSAYPDMPDFTHYIEAFVCTLDYILVTNNFEVEKSGATPSRQDIKKYVAMPNECMPSDHVSLVCDLKWR